MKNQGSGTFQSHLVDPTVTGYHGATGGGVGFLTKIWRFAKSGVSEDQFALSFGVEGGCGGGIARQVQLSSLPTGFLFGIDLSSVKYTADATSIRLHGDIFAS
ncbi:hypothetical protein V6N13_106547 [Hibiscus sabdariffa]|uniref:Uncharacterized protein n=1 Tax=Hibiscus sabdariffa TaxID=183260 RepID=A0ABR2F109_9ROSI